MNKVSKENETETTKERYMRLLGGGSTEALIQMVKEGEADIAAGKVYTAQEVKEHFQRRQQQRNA